MSQAAVEDALHELDKATFALAISNAVAASEGEILRLRVALKFYAEATVEDFAKDNGFNASAALTK